MKPIQIIAGLVLSAALVSPAHATTGKELKGFCDAEEQSWREGFCTGYITGVFETLDGQQQKLYCAPDGLLNQRMWAVIEKYLRDHPEEWHEYADEIVMQAFIEAFPCPEEEQ